MFRTLPICSYFELYSSSRLIWLHVLYYPFYYLSICLCNPFSPLFLFMYHRYFLWFPSVILVLASIIMLLDVFNVYSCRWYLGLLKWIFMVLSIYYPTAGPTSLKQKCLHVAGWHMREKEKVYIESHVQNNSHRSFKIFLFGCAC